MELTTLISTHIIIFVVALLIALLTGISYYKHKSEGIKYFTLFYIVIAFYALFFTIPALMKNSVLLSYGNLFARIFLFIGIIFISKTTIFTQDLPKIFLTIIRTLLLIGIFISIIIFVYNTPEVEISNGSYTFNIDLFSRALIGMSTGTAGILWSYLIYANILPTSKMSYQVRLKAYILSIAGFLIGTGLTLFFMSSNTDIILLGIMMTLVGYISKLIVFSIWKYYHLDRDSAFSEVA